MESDHIHSAIVVGGAGHLGAALVNYLLKKKVDVTVFDVVKSKSSEVKSIVGDITKYEDVKNALSGMEVVFHVAALIEVTPWCSQRMWDVNVNGTENIIKACIENGITRLVYTSTTDVNFTGQPVTDSEGSLDYPTNPATGYMKTKCAAEKLVLESNGKLCSNKKPLCTCSLRPTQIYGPGCVVYTKGLPVIDKMGFFPVWQCDEQDFVSTSNLSHAHYLAALNLYPDSPVSGQFYVINEDFFISYFDFIKLGLEARSNTKLREVHIPYIVIYILGLLMTYIYIFLYHIGIAPKEVSLSTFHVNRIHSKVRYSHKKAKKDFGYEPIFPTKDCMKETLDWVKNYMK